MRPRERCLEHGPTTLSLTECLAVLLGSGPPGLGAQGLAEKILLRHIRSESGLTHAPESEVIEAFFTALEVSDHAHLRSLPGLGSAGRARILAAFEMGRRYANHRDRRRKSTRLTTAHDSSLEALKEQAAERVSIERRSDAREWLGFIPLLRDGRLGDLGITEMGGRTHVNTDPTELFARVLALRPRGFFLFHNHPSGDPTPSYADRELTLKVDRIAKQLETRLLGHAVVTIGDERWIPT